MPANEACNVVYLSCSDKAYMSLLQKLVSAGSRWVDFALTSTRFSSIFPPSIVDAVYQFEF